METVSSPYTFLYKFVLTGFWVVFFALTGVGLLVGGPPASWGVRLAETSAAALAGFLVWLNYGTLKRVELNGSLLEISNYRDSISVAASDIESVYENPWVTRQLTIVTITFKCRTPFGDSVAFVPPFAPRLHAEHEVVDRLRRLAGDGARASSV